jgi:tungstate transport system ATP-binding protein
VKPMLEAENLRLDKSSREIFNVEGLTLDQHEVLALVGPNGAGKTSLLLTLALLQNPSAGVIRFAGRPVRKPDVLALRRRMAVVFQDALLLDTSVQGNILTALRIRGVPRREATARAEKWLDQFGIGPLARRKARTLSGGEAQRASLARAFALEPEILFLDEPFAALDYPTRNTLLNDMGRILKDMRITTLFVTHDYTEIPPLAQRVAVLFGGRIVKCGAVNEVFGEEFLHRKSWAPWEG